MLSIKVCFLHCFGTVIKVEFDCQRTCFEGGSMTVRHKHLCMELDKEVVNDNLSIARRRGLGFPPRSDVVVPFLDLVEKKNT